MHFKITTKNNRIATKYQQRLSYLSRQKNNKQQKHP